MEQGQGRREWHGCDLGREESIGDGDYGPGCSAHQGVSSPVGPVHYMTKLLGFCTCHTLFFSSSSSACACDKFEVERGPKLPVMMYADGNAVRARSVP